MSTRRYDSPIRTAQLAATRAQILDGALRLLAAEGIDELTIPAVAKATGLSPATAYRHFPTLDDLMLGLFEWLRPQVGQTTDRLMGVPPDRLSTIAGENYARFEEHAAVLLPLMESRVFNRMRLGSDGRRAPRGAGTFRAVAPDASDGELEAIAGAVYLLIAPQSWRWLRETWGLDAAAATHATRWAIDVLVEAIREGRGLDSKADARADATITPAAAAEATEGDGS